MDNDCSKSRLSYSGSVEKISPTNRPGSENALTYRIFELWDLELPDPVLQTIVDLSEMKGSDVKLVTEDEIQNLVTRDGIKIADHALFLVSDETEPNDSIQNKLKGVDKIRFSCACLVRLTTRQHGHKKYVLLVNYIRKLEHNEVELSPLGGALRYHDSSILARFDATPTEECEPTDLRLLMPSKNATDFKEWFYSQDGRETSPLNEMKQELVNESKVLKPEVWERCADAIRKNSPVGYRGGRSG